MDTLALLCNLHADGPETLQRLRSAGWDTLREIQAVDVLELEQVLEADRGRAVRFQREAGILRERLGGEHEPTPVIDRREPEPAPSRTVEPPRVKTPQAAETPDFAKGPAKRSANSEQRRPFAAARLTNRSEIPLSEPEPEPDASVAGELEDVNELALTSERPVQVASELELPARDVLIPVQAARAAAPTPPSNPEPTPPVWREAEEVRQSRIEPGAIDGLDAETSQRLAEAGVESLEDLAGAPALELSRETGLELTHLLRLSFLARRAVASAETAPKPPAPAPGEARPREEVSPDAGGDVAGPFA